MNDLAQIEHQLSVYRPKFQELLPPSVSPDRFVRTVMMSIEKTPKLLQCHRETLMASAMSAAVLGLECDGATGQAYILPFKQNAQLIIGYKGYNTMAARSGWTISGAVVREDDQFNYELGSRAYVTHTPILGTEGDRKIIAVWACATHHRQPPVIKVLSIDEVLAVKSKSPGAKRSDSPWNDAAIGFPAMCEKTAKRRLARNMPLNTMVLAASMEEAHEELGSTAHINQDGSLMIDGQSTVVDSAPSVAAAPPSMEKMVLHFAEKSIEYGTITEWVKQANKAINLAIDKGKLAVFMEKNSANIKALMDKYPKDVGPIINLLGHHGEEVM